MKVDLLKWNESSHRNSSPRSRYLRGLVLQREFPRFVECGGASSLQHRTTSSSNQAGMLINKLQYCTVRSLFAAAEPNYIIIIIHQSQQITLSTTHLLQPCGSSSGRLKHEIEVLHLSVEPVLLVHNLQRHAFSSWKCPLLNNEQTSPHLELSAKSHSQNSCLTTNARDGKDRIKYNANWSGRARAILEEVPFSITNSQSPATTAC